MSEETETRGFWRSVPGLLTAAAAAITAVAGLVAALSQAGLLSPRAEEPAAGSAAISGEWTAQVGYPWNATHPETFSFRVEDGRVVGTATFLGSPRPIEDGRIAGDRLSFTTRAEELLGEELRGFENRYDGLVSVRGIHFVLQDTRGNVPIEFTARRDD